VAALTEVWSDLAGSGLYSGSTLGRVRHFARTRTHAHSNEPLRALLRRHHGDALIEDLAVPFQCVAASIERAAEHWFAEGPVIDAVLASSAVPGVFPPVEIGAEHYLDGGLVNSIPVGRALTLGAQTVYVLQVGRVERPLAPPRTPFEVGMVAFEIARRHRFAADLASVPEGVQVHVLPTGATDPPRYGDLSSLRYRDFSRTGDRIEQAYRATLDHLERSSR
jgi:NTE family protein